MVKFRWLDIKIGKTMVKNRGSGAHKALRGHPMQCLGTPRGICTQPIADFSALPAFSQNVHVTIRISGSSHP